ncbi:MAG: ABC transporter ATP-binding protein [Parachlamydiaceae bacterium]|nr:ABC transporter ATP-binding protein [Parachlamydiaceae bacterium]
MEIKFSMHIVTSKESLNFVLRSISKFKFSIFIMVFTSVLWSINASLSPYFIKIMLDRVSEGVRAEAISYLLLPSIGYISLGLSMIFVFRLYGYFVEIVMIPRLRQKIANNIFDYILRHSHYYYQNNFSGSIATKLTILTSNIPELLQTGIDRLLSRFLGVIVAILVLWIVSIKFALLLMVWAISFMIYAVIVSKKLQIESTILSEFGSLITGKIVDTLSNILSVRLFARQNNEKNYLNKTLRDSVFAEQKMQWTYFWIWFVYGLSYGITESIVLYNLIIDFKNNMISVGDFVLVLTINLSVVQFFWMLALEYSDFSKKLGRITQALQMITSPIEIVDNENAKVLIVRKGQIDFDNVRFCYKNTDPLFHNLSIRINGGEKVGLVGYSGSGKTSFVNLILRLYEIDEGTILIDGQSTKECTQNSLHEAIGTIPQDPSLFHRTLLENISYGKPDASEEEIYTASKQAHIHEFIQNLNNGYQSLVGERGVKLSGGQRQRIAIARAMLKNAPILILDEATSQLDSVTENDIQSSLWGLMKNKTTLVIAHRLSTLLHMDRILVFNKGKIVEDGTHKNLLMLNGLYKILWEAQVGGFLPDKEIK